MRKINFLIFIVLMIFSCTSTPVNIDAGLIAYYPFDGNAMDVSGKNSNLIIEEAVLTMDRFGNKNSAYRFDGSSSLLFAQTSNMPAIESAKTISWWYFSNEMPQYQIESGAENMIVLVDSASDMGIQFGFRAPGYETKGFDTWEWGGGTFMQMDHPEFGIWHHCIYTYDGSAHSIYIDGEKITTSTIEPKSGIPTQLMLGNYPGGDQFFEGKLDDIRIYNRVLGQLEIDALYRLKQ